MPHVHVESDDNEKYADDDDDNIVDESDDNEKEEVESDEEVVRDRVEVDRGYTYVVEDGFTVPDPRLPPRLSSEGGGVIPFNMNYITKSFLSPLLPNLPLIVIIISRYGTKYEYVGLVKAYNRALAGFRFWIRFKACLSDQDQ
ncbi:hypothetical protein AgCh_003298 [Apium graveolens]